MYGIHRCPVSSARSTQKFRGNNNNNNMRRWNRVTSTYDASINCSSSQPFLALPMRANTLDRSHHFESGALLNRRHYHDVWYICTPAVLVQWAMTHYSDKMNMSWPIFARHWLQHWDRASGPVNASLSHLFFFISLDLVNFGRWLFDCSSTYCAHCLWSLNYYR